MGGDWGTVRPHLSEHFGEGQNCLDKCGIHITEAEMHWFD